MRRQEREAAGSVHCHARLYEGSLEKQHGRDKGLRRACYKHRRVPELPRRKHGAGQGEEGGEECSCYTLLFYIPFNVDQTWSCDKYSLTSPPHPTLPASTPSFDLRRHCPPHPTTSLLHISLPIPASHLSSLPISRFAQYFLKPDVNYSEECKLSYRGESDISRYLCNYILNEPQYTEEARNCQTFAADFYSFLSGTAIEPYHAVCRVMFKVRIT